MTWQEFKVAHNFRTADRCCENCKHGLVGWEGECDCRHPLLDDYIGCKGETISDVCDLWERSV